MAKGKNLLNNIGRNIVNQIIPVMIGVYLGFALNNYGENRKVKKQKATFEKMLFNEITGNLENVTKSLPYHLNFKKDIDSLSKEEAVFDAFDNYVITGLRLPRLNSGAYDTGVQTGIFGTFDLNFVQLINRLYTTQNAYVQTNNSILSSMISKDQPDDDKETLKMLATLDINLNDIIAGENDLQGFYCEILRIYFKAQGDLFEENCVSVREY